MIGPDDEDERLDATVEANDEYQRRSDEAAEHDELQQIYERELGESGV